MKSKKDIADEDNTMECNALDNFSDPLIEMLMVKWNSLRCTFLIMNYYMKDFRKGWSKPITIAEKHI